MTHASLEDKYDLTVTRFFISGTQALVRLPLMQRARDAAAGLNTAGFISGYRGSPLGGYDLQLAKERSRLEAANIRVEPGVNEDLAATAIWGTQQAPLLPGAKVDGVFAIWYGKGPGVDRSGDPIKHGNRAGTAPHGGVLVVFGDDHAGKSSTVAHQSEQSLVASGVPVLYPATVQEYLEYGVYGFALSRYAGVWVGFKCVNETVEATSSVEIEAAHLAVVRPDPAKVLGELPPGGVNSRLAFDALGDEVRLMRAKLPLARAFARANQLDRITHGASGQSRNLGILAAGKTWLDVVQAFAALGLVETRLASLGVALYKPAMIWPLEPQGLTEFARGRRELFVVEEKAAFMEPQAAHALYNLSQGDRPRLIGKQDALGYPVLPADVQLEPLDIALALGARLWELGLVDAALEDRLALLKRGVGEARERTGGPIARLPYFCSGCPHNTSTRVPEGSLALAGIGCHTMALYMNRQTLPPTQMGGEGVNWTGIAPFSGTPHVFQNLGDGTYFHSGLLAIRAAVTAGVNITYKILVNDAVAMTGGQRVEGQLSVAEITHQLRAERVQRIAVVTDERQKYERDAGLARGTTTHGRDDLDAVQRELRGFRGVSALIYEQTCAAEKRRRRRRGQHPDPERRLLINELVCEGCADCSVQSNCLSVEPLETEFGRKRCIDQSSCNKDYSCVKGFCPSFVVVEGGALRKPQVADLGAGDFESLPEPARAARDTACAILITGIGGTGVVTVGAVLGMAAHLDGLTASAFDMSGLAQKGGAVLSHLKIAPAGPHAAPARIGLLEADVVLGSDLVVTASLEALRALKPAETRVLLNSHLVPTAAFQLNPEVDFRQSELRAKIESVAGCDHVESLDANRAALALLGDTLGTNMLMVGYALQKGWLPVSRASVERAVELNGAAVSFNLRALALGRLAAHAPQGFAKLLAAASPVELPTAQSLAELMAVRREFLTDYQDDAYAARYAALVERVAAVEREHTPGLDALARAVARYYFKLLAYKDEYEVARLHTGALHRQLATTFEGKYRIKYQLAPRLLSRKDPVTGQPRKIEFGSWMRLVFRVLARLKILRGTALDPFGYAGERRLERRLICDYETTVDELLSGLNRENHTLAIEIASLPEGIRGYGHVKERHYASTQRRERELLSRWRSRHAAERMGQIDCIFPGANTDSRREQ